MEIFPGFNIGLFNGWLLVAIFYLVFGVVLLLLPRPVVARLYERPRRRGAALVRRILAVLLILVWLFMTIMTPFTKDAAVLAAGLAIYAAGLVGFVAALINYAAAPLDQPVTAGLYRVSRNPQQVMLSLAFLGVSIAMGSWTALGMIAIGVIGGHIKIVGEEKACLAKYGESYRAYMQRVPRYFLFF